LVAKKLGADADAKGPGIFDPFNYNPVIVVAYSSPKGWSEDELGGDGGWCLADAIVSDMSTGKPKPQRHGVQHRVMPSRIRS